MYKCSLLLVFIFFFSCSDNDYPRTYDFKEVQLGENGFYVIGANNSLVSVDLFPDTETIETYEEGIVDFIVDGLPISSITIESETRSTILSAQGSTEVSYVNTNDILTFDNSVVMRFNGDNIEMCTQLVLAGEGPFININPSTGEYDVLLFNSCDAFNSYQDALSLKAQEYARGDTLFFAQPLLVFE